MINLFGRNGNKSPNPEPKTLGTDDLPILGDGKKREKKALVAFCESPVSSLSLEFATAVLRGAVGIDNKIKVQTIDGSQLEVSGRFADEASTQWIEANKESFQSSDIFVCMSPHRIGVPMVDMARQVSAPVILVLSRFETAVLGDDQLPADSKLTEFEKKGTARERFIYALANATVIVALDNEVVDLLSTSELLRPRLMKPRTTLAHPPKQMSSPPPSDAPNRLLLSLLDAQANTDLLKIGVYCPSVENINLAEINAQIHDYAEAQGLTNTSIAFHTAYMELSNDDLDKTYFFVDLEQPLTNNQIDALLIWGLPHSHTELLETTSIQLQAATQFVPLFTNNEMASGSLEIPEFSFLREAVPQLGKIVASNYRKSTRSSEDAWH